MSKGFTLLEIIIYIAILSLVLLVVSSFIFYFLQSNAQTKGDREVLENARRVLEEMTYEINSAKSIYTPTTTSSQLSLETLRYLPENENTTYIDFFICGYRICLKKESQNPIFLTADSVSVPENGLTFTQISNGGFNSIKISLTMNYKNPTNNLSQSVNLTSSASLRNY